MSLVHLFPCNHTLDAPACANTFAKSNLNIRVTEVTQSVFDQINRQTPSVQVRRSLCRNYVDQVEAEEKSDGRFPMSTPLFDRIHIEPLRVELHEKGDTAKKVDNAIHFTFVELANIENGEAGSKDSGRTYRLLSDLANDFDMLTSMLGPVVGRMLYILPTSWKSGAYISGMKKAAEKGLDFGNWLLTDKEGKLIGNFSLSEIDKKKFGLEKEFAKRKLYNVGVMLRSEFQRRGVVTEITRALYEQIGRLRFDVDGLFIYTRPDNAGVNALANKLNFTYLKTSSVEVEDLFPWTTYMEMNLYWKPF